MAEIFLRGHGPARRRAKQGRSGPREGSWLASAAHEGRERERLLSEEAAKAETAEDRDPFGFPEHPLLGHHEARSDLLSAGRSGSDNGVGSPLRPSMGVGQGVGRAVHYWRAARLVLGAYGAAALLGAAVLAVAALIFLTNSQPHAPPGDPQLSQPQRGETQGHRTGRDALVGQG
jgi:hypothetical protein